MNRVRPGKMMGPHNTVRICLFLKDKVLGKRRPDSGNKDPKDHTKFEFQIKQVNSNRDQELEDHEIWSQADLSLKFSSSE